MSPDKIHSDLRPDDLAEDLQARRFRRDPELRNLALRPLMPKLNRQRQE